MDHGLFASLTDSGFIPHGHCYLWTPALVAMFVLGDGVIAASYYSIPAALLVLVRKRRDLKFNWVVVMFSAFIFACGTTHLVAIWNIWHADYWLDAWLKVGTAAVSAATAIALWPLLPKALAIPTVRELEDSVAALRRENEQRRRAEAEAIAAREAAEAANRAKSEFLSRMSHELRTPLNAVLGFAQVMRLQASAGPEVVRERAAEIERAGWHLLSMIDDVLDLSRIESGRMTISHEQVDLGAAVAECVAMNTQQAAAAGVTLDNRVPASGPTVLGDRTRVLQVLNNLLSNAIKYNREDGRVTLLADAAGDTTRLRVVDTGIGLDEAQQARLFQPFDRLGAERSDRPGTGIGLVICKHLLQQMHGSLEVASQRGVGSTFSFTLRSAPAMPRPAATRSPVPAPAPGAAPRVVLYIEDNPSNVSVMREVLALEGGTVLHVAETGAAGRELAQRLVPDVIVVDIALPDTDGYALCREFRADPRLARGVIVALSANAMPADIEAGQRAGFDAYLTKPLDVERFRTIVQDLLDRRTAPARD